MLNTSKLLLLAGLLLASGCTTTPRAHNPSATDPAVSASAQAANPGEEAAQNAEFPPKVLYQLLVAEVAGQRGQVEVAVANYLAAARETWDINIVKRATRLAVFAQALREALVAGQLWLELEPASIEGLQIVAPLLLTFDRRDEAVAHFQRLLKASADMPDHGLIQVANQLARERDQEAAMAVMDTLLVGRENDPYAWLGKAQLASRQQQPAAALAAADQALTLHPHWAPAVVLRAQVLHGMGEKDAALAFLAEERQGELAEDEAVGLNYARMLADAGKLEEALAEFERLSQQQPGNGALHFAAGVLALQFQMLDQAEAHFKQALNLGHRQPEAIYHLGRVYEAKGDAGQAIRLYQAVQSDDYYFDAQMRIGNLLVKEAGLDAAIKHLRSIRVANEDEQVRLMLLEAEWLRGAGRDREALDFYTQKLQQFPESHALHYARALVAEKLHQLELAEQDLLFIIQREPDNAQALNALGYTLADRTTRYQEALGYIERALALEPDEAVIVDSMGWVHYRLGNLPKAEAYLRRALSLMKDPEVAAHLGEVLWMMGKQQEAVSLWKAFREQFPAHEALRNVMQRFGQ